MTMLFIGGNGNISYSCVRLAIELKNEVYVLSRRPYANTRKKLPSEVKIIEADARNKTQMQDIFKSLFFDIVCDFICFNENDAILDIEIFKEKTNHFIFISTEAIYKRQSKFLPFKENTPQYNIDISSDYINGKIKAEIIFKKAYENENFPVTILRPSYTYDTIIPTPVGANCFTVIEYLKNTNTIIQASQSYALRVFTHSKDFATALLGIMQNRSSIGQDYHATTDEWLTWNDVVDILTNVLHIHNSKIITADIKTIINSKLLGQKELLMQKYWHNIYDNTKIKSLLPLWRAEISFKEGIKESINWFEEDKNRKRINLNLNLFLKQLGE